MEALPKPKLFYGLYIVAACFIVLFFLWGMVLNTFPVFLKPISESMGWSRKATSFALLMGAIGTVLSAPIAGKLIDQFGAKLVMTAGTLLVGLSLLVGSRVTQPWQIYVVFACIGCGLMCSSIIPCSLLISNWFISRRGLAMGIAFVGTSVGGMMSIVATWIIMDYGWRTAFVASGVTILVVVVPVILLLIRTHPSEMGLEPYHQSEIDAKTSKNVWGVSVKEAFSLKVFWQIAAVMLIIGFVQGGLGNHCVAYFTDLGHSQERAGFAWTIVMGSMVFGKLMLGPIADRWGPKNAMAGACVLFCVSILLVTMARPYWLVIVFASLYGFASGAPLTINPLLTAGNLGTKNFGAIYGTLNIMSLLGGAVSPVVAGAVFDKHGSYLPIFFALAPLVVVAGLFAVFMKPLPQHPELS